MCTFYNVFGFGGAGVRKWTGRYDSKMTNFPDVVVKIIKRYGIYQRTEGDSSRGRFKTSSAVLQEFHN